MGRMRIWAVLLVAAAMTGCGRGQGAAMQRPSPESMQLTTYDGKQVVALEYAVPVETGTGPRSIYLYDAKTGDCLNVIHAPSEPGDQMLITHAPCK